MVKRNEAQWKQILELFRVSPKGLICQEVVTRLKLSHQSASARIHELWHAGCLIETPMTRHTTRGKAATVFVLDPKASDERYMEYRKEQEEERLQAALLNPERTWEAQVLYAARFHRDVKTQASLNALREAVEKN